MRALTLSLSAAVLLTLTVACDDPKQGPEAAATASATAAAAAPSAAPVATATATAAASASADPVAKGIRAPRPFPLGSSGPVQPSAPAEQQMMAIGYTIAMLAAQNGDPLVDQPAIDAIAKKVEGVVRGADKGTTPANPVTSTKGGRLLEVNMGKGCTDKTPSNLLEQRASVTLKQAYESGILVVMCRDNKWACHQSTRDPSDVLCLAAPR